MGFRVTEIIKIEGRCARACGAHGYPAIRLLDNPDFTPEPLRSRRYDKIAAVGTAFRLRRNLSKLHRTPMTTLAAIGVLLIHGPTPRPLCRPETSANLQN